MSDTASGATSATIDAIETEQFMKLVARDVAGTLEEIVGLEEAKGFLSIVGDHMGTRLDDFYRQQHGAGPWGTGTVGEVLVDLKRRIGGTFEVVHSDDRHIEFHNSHCPFGDAVIGRPSLCMMTSNVFGRIAANHLGHVTVELDEAIARGDRRCVVRVARDPELEHSNDNQRHYVADD